ncbi:MAG: hypothetical protein ACE5GV_10625, partial [Candidatus Scalindua sp.]
MINNDSVKRDHLKMIMWCGCQTFMRMALLLIIVGYIVSLAPGYVLFAQTLPKGKELTIVVSRKK